MEKAKAKVVCRGKLMRNPAFFGGPKWRGWFWLPAQLNSVAAAVTCGPRQYASEELQGTDSQEPGAVHIGGSSASKRLAF